MVDSHNLNKLLVTCTCGQNMVVPATAIGKTVKCPRCGRSLSITHENTRPYSPLPAKPKTTAAPKDRGPAQHSVGSKNDQPTKSQKLVVTCDCGHRMIVPATAIGKAVKCPKCGRSLSITLENTGPYSPKLPKPKAPSAPEQSGSVQPATSAGPDQPTKSQKLVVTCACGQRIIVPSTAIGKAVKCPKCGRPVKIIKEEAQPFSRESGQATSKDKEHRVDTSKKIQAPQTGPVNGVGQEEVYPWSPQPVLLSKIEKYNEDKKYKSFFCKCNEYLNILLKNYTFRDLRYEVDLRIYPDLVAVDEREIPPGCLEGLVMMMPEKVKAVLGPLLGILIFLIRAPVGIFYTLIGFTVLAAVGVCIIIALIDAPLVTISVIVLLIAGRIIQVYINRKRIVLIARKILDEPESPYAIRKLYKLADLVPRIWQRGDVSQIVRLNTRRRVLQRFLILVIQGNPLPTKAGCLNTGAGVFIGRMMRADRRIYVLSIDDGEAAADDAAKAMANVLGVKIVRAKFVFNNLRLE